jgi:hypothetical protein
MFDRNRFSTGTKENGPFREWEIGMESPHGRGHLGTDSQRKNSMDILTLVLKKRKVLHMKDTKGNQGLMQAGN